MTYLTTAEVAELKGCSLQYVQKCIKEGKIEASVRENAANNRTEYRVPLTALTEKQQIKWENKKRSELGLESVSLPCKAAPKPDPQQITLQNLMGNQRDNVGFWCEILQEWQRVRTNRGDNLGKCKGRRAVLRDRQAETPKHQHFT